MEQLEQGRAVGLAENDVVDVRRSGIGEDVVGDATATRDRHGIAAEAVGEAQGVGDAVARGLVEGEGSRALDRDGGPGRVQPVRETFGVAHEAGRARILTDADEDPFAPRPTDPRWHWPACG